MWPIKWKTKDEFPLGNWIYNKRTEKTAGRLDAEKVRQLGGISMVSDAFSEKWSRALPLRQSIMLTTAI